MNRIVLKAKCPGCNGKRCPVNGMAGPQGGRCLECRKEMNRIGNARVHAAKKKGTFKSRRKVGEGTLAKRKEIAEAMAVKGAKPGIRGAIEVINAMQRAADV